MKNILIIITLLLAACGQEKESDPAYAVEDAGGPHALALDSKKDLPKCNDKNQNQLIYLTSEKEFFTCDDGNWETINIKMQAPKVETAETESALSGAFWSDKKSGKVWYVMSELRFSQNDCGGYASTQARFQANFKERTSDDIKEALRNGIFKGVNVRVFVGPQTYVFSNFPSVEYSTVHVGFVPYCFNICLVQQ